MRHTFSVYVEDKPGVLNRIASLFRRRAFNHRVPDGRTHGGSGPVPDDDLRGHRRGRLAPP